MEAGYIEKVCDVHLVLWREGESSQDILLSGHPVMAQRWKNAPVGMRGWKTNHSGNLLVPHGENI